jgi:DNA polymerase-3 subunit beta
MKFSCFQTDLLNAINIVQKAVSSKTTLEILKGILIEVKEDSVKLTGYDLNMAIEIVIEAQVEEQGKMVLDSRLFGEIVRKLPDATIDFAVKDNFIEINCLHSNFKLTSYNSEDYPKIPIIENSQKMSFNQDLFKNLIKQTLFAVSTDETRPILTGSLLETGNGKMTMVSIDGYRMALKSVNIENIESSKTVIPGKTLSEIIKILNSSSDQEAIVEITDKYIAFEIEGIRLISKILEGEFIKYEQIIPTEFNTQIKINAIELHKAIDRASLMAREMRSATVKMSFQDQYVEISSISEVGSVKDKVNIILDGERLEIGFNPRYLSDVLRVIESEEVVLELSSSLSPCIIRPTNDDQYTYLVLPVRMSS